VTPQILPFPSGKKGYPVEAMPTKDAFKTIGEVIDHVEWLREELLTIQRALEKMESLETSVSGDGTKKC